MSAEIIRQFGSGFRSSLTTTYSVHGQTVGLGIAKRYAWEIGDLVAEIHGRDVAAELLYSAGDALVRRDRVATLQELSAEADEPPQAVIPAPEFAELMADRIMTVMAARQPKRWSLAPAWWVSGFLFAAAMAAMLWGPRL